MIGDENPYEQARQDQIAALKAELEKLEYARDAFDAQVEYADRQVEIHNKRIKQVKQQLKEI